MGNLDGLLLWLVGVKFDTLEGLCHVNWPTLRWRYVETQKNFVCLVRVYCFTIENTHMGLKKYFHMSIHR